MRVLAYIHIRRALGQTTGVARHAIRMVRGLIDRHGLDVHLLGARGELALQRRTQPHWALADVPAHGHRLSRAMMERWWFLASRPPSDSYWPSADWLYLPNEAYVPARRARVAATVHDLDALEPNLPWSDHPTVIRIRRAWRAKIGRMVDRADVVLAVSQFTRGRIVELLNIPPDRIVVVGNGVDERFFTADATGPSSGLGNPPYLLHVGALNDKKGAPAVIALAKRLAARRSPIEIHISGHIEEQYTGTVAALSNIRPLGFVPDDRIPSLMQQSVALILLSRYEGFGMPPLEAMAAGAPAIVSHHAARPEIAGGAGIVVNPDEPDDAADAAERLLTDSQWRNPVIARGREHARRFTWDACVDRLVAALRNPPDR
jgi:glycosyltransferase involved in cell wall biosynthesis